VSRSVRPCRSSCDEEVPFLRRRDSGAAIKCRYCGSDLSAQPSHAPLPDSPTRSVAQPPHRSCPFCSARIPAIATMCPSCGDDVSHGAATPSTAGPAATERASGTQQVRPATLLGAAIVVIAVVYLAFSSSDLTRISPSVDDRPPTSTTARASNSPTSSNLTAAQRNAVRSASAYLKMSGFSRQGLIDQLSSEYGDRFSVEDATVAVDSLEASTGALKQRGLLLRT
jgi:hypothetical protein